MSNMNFTPFVLTTFGKLGSGSAAFLSDLIKGLPKHDLMPLERLEQERQYQQQLQLALKREVARMLLQGAWQDPMEPEQEGLGASEAAEQEAEEDFDEGDLAPGASTEEPFDPGGRPRCPGNSLTARPAGA